MRGIASSLKTKKPRAPAMLPTQKKKKIISANGKFYVFTNFYFYENLFSIL